jgi:uncharacterized protein (DUF1697 family)
MTAFIALLRAVNVGGRGKMPMAELRSLCEAAGFLRPRTYIASGNIVFDSDDDEATVKVRLEGALADHAGKPVGVLVRNGAEMAAVLAANPFPAAAPNWTIAVFLDRPPLADALASCSGVDNEKLALGRREIYVHYPSGMGRSKLKIPAASDGTARNMNTIATLAAWAGQ